MKTKAKQNYLKIGCQGLGFVYLQKRNFFPFFYLYAHILSVSSGILVSSCTTSAYYLLDILCLIFVLKDFMRYVFLSPAYILGNSQ